MIGIDLRLHNHVANECNNHLIKSDFVDAFVNRHNLPMVKLSHLANAGIKNGYISFWFVN